MSLPSERIIEKISFSFIVYSLVSGFVLLFFSPMKYYEPFKKLVDYFLNNPVDLNAALVILLFAFCLGIPMFFAHSSLLGNRGINRLAKALFKKILPNGEEKQKNTENTNISPDRRESDLRFLEKLATDHKVLNSYWEKIIFQKMIVDGSIMGLETSWLLYGIVTIQNAFQDTGLFVRGLVTFAVFLLICLYNRCIFSPDADRKMHEIEVIVNTSTSKTQKVKDTRTYHNQFKL